MTNLFDVETV